jgi:asparagine synthase (glutamine-hydrolysing)
VVEFAIRLANNYKFRNGQQKWILKEILKEYLPNNLVERPKWGFSVPLSQWLKQELFYLIEQYLSETITNEIGIFNYAYIHSLKTHYLKGKEYLYNRLWVVIVLHKWLKENA